MCDHLIEELLSWQKDWIYDTRLNFPEGISVKYSPRAGSQSLKKLLIDITFPDTDFNFLDSKRILQRIKIHNFKCDTLIAVKRNPIDRFISALNYDHKTWEQCPDSIESVFNSNWIKFMFKYNKHYWPQTFYLGSEKEYDLIFDTNELDKFTFYLNQKYQSDYSIPQINTTAKYFTKDMLSEDHIKLIKDMYSEDYDNGWY